MGVWVGVWVCVGGWVCGCVDVGVGVGVGVGGGGGSRCNHFHSTRKIMATYSVGFIAPKIRAEANHIMIQHWKNICREFTCRSSLESSLSVHIYIKLCNKVNCKTVEAFLDTSTTSICTLALAVASIYCNCSLFE